MRPRGGPDSFAIGAAEPQEALPYTVKTSCACGTPIAELSGPPEACRELTAEQEEIDRLAAEP